VKRRAPAPEVALLLRMLEEGYRRKAWHGPNLKGSLRGVTARDAAWRPSPRRHNVWELAVHAAYWKYAVRRLLTGEKRGSFPRKGSNWFPAPAAASESAWKEAGRLLEGEHRKLREAVIRLRPADLSVRPRGSKRDVATLVYGAAAHDVYHAGQIQLLKVLRRGKRGR
jgi:hypothetical protein